MVAPEPDTCQPCARKALARRSEPPRTETRMTEVPPDREADRGRALDAGHTAHGGKACIDRGGIGRHELDIDRFHRRSCRLLGHESRGLRHGGLGDGHFRDSTAGQKLLAKLCERTLQRRVAARQGRIGLELAAGQRLAVETVHTLDRLVHHVGQSLLGRRFKAETAR
ncbi:hypothetical protein MBENS4_4342 [Novosphingobium sp. MBES04]|nr:hypothetical protein MBENS4_4342 [Novosphingobium sp. MBES04]